VNIFSEFMKMEDLSVKFHSYKAEFSSRFIIMGPWTKKGGPTPKTFPSAGKVMASVFQDAFGNNFH